MEASVCACHASIHIGQVKLRLPIQRVPSMNHLNFYNVLLLNAPQAAACRIPLFRSIKLVVRRDRRVHWNLIGSDSEAEIRGAQNHLYDLHHWYRFPDHHHLDGHERPSFLDLYHRDFESGHGLVYRSRVGRLSEVNNPDDGVGRECVLRDAANDDHLDRGHDQSQSAKRQREEYEPTIEEISI